MENTEEGLRNKSISQQEQIIIEGKNVIRFDTVNAIQMLRFTGSNQNVEMVNDSTVLLTFIHDKQLYSFSSSSSSSKYISSINEEITVYKFSKDSSLGIISINKNTIVHSDLNTQNPQRHVFRFNAQNALFLPKMIILCNDKRILLIALPEMTVFKNFRYNNLKKSYKVITSIIAISNDYIALLGKNQLDIIDIGHYYQRVTSINIDEKKNKYMCLVNGTNGRVIEHKDFDKSNYGNDWNLLVATGIEKKLEMFSYERYDSIRQLIDDDKVVRFDKMDKNERYLFVMSNYFYVYDVMKREYVQKIASLLTNNYCFCFHGFMIYFSSPAFYTVRYSLDEQEDLLNK